MITLKIDNRSVTVPEGSLIVDAAMKLGIEIPVFCYHPKMKPVGMCRMCLVDIGRPVVDRATNQVVLEADGSPKIAFGPKLDTACTTPVSEGMVVVTDSEKVKAARKEVVEFLLTSHPLDCPVCDKGGECPLQNLTMAHGVAKSRFPFDEKMHLGKHVPLGELILLDRERCIQCGRCTRFQHEVVDDPVISFYQRGRELQIVTLSEPGFDSIFSGNTTDICPVGALTTVDFHFGARTWEMNSAASICDQCPVGCNIVYNTRREAKTGGKMVIKRVMPRQNEEVNETWICDKGRFAFHSMVSRERLTQPLVRKNGVLEPATWDEALDMTAEALKRAFRGRLVLAGGRLSNEDLFNLRAVAGDGKAALYTPMGGGEYTARVGVSAGTDIGKLGKGSAILVVASDLHEEAPIWWLRLKQAAERGAIVIVLNARATRLDKFAKHVLRYNPGDEAALVSALLPATAIKGTEEIQAVSQAFSQAENSIILFGSDGLSLANSTALAHACADLLQQTNHIGRANNGLIGVWSNGNTQGAYELGFQPLSDLESELSAAPAVLIAGADPAGDDPALARALENGAFLAVQELFLTETAKLADVVFPALPHTEREGSYTSGERRVQRFYDALPPEKDCRADFTIAAEIGKRMGLDLEGRSAALILKQTAGAVPAFAGLTYQKLAEVHEQLPIVGRKDMYYGGTTYDNHEGLGSHLQSTAINGAVELPRPPAVQRVELDSSKLLFFPVTRLYDGGSLMKHNPLLKERLAGRVMEINPDTAARFDLAEREPVEVKINGVSYTLVVHLSADVPANLAILPRSVGVPLNGITALAPAKVVQLLETRERG